MCGVDNRVQVRILQNRGFTIPGFINSVMIPMLVLGLMCMCISDSRGMSPADDDDGTLKPALDQNQGVDSDLGSRKSKNATTISTSRPSTDSITGQGQYADMIPVSSTVIPVNHLFRENRGSTGNNGSIGTVSSLSSSSKRFPSYSSQYARQLRFLDKSSKPKSPVRLITKYT